VASEPDRQVRGVIVGPAADGSSYFVLPGPITDDQEDQNAAAAVNGQSASVLQATDRLIIIVIIIIIITVIFSARWPHN